jgi:hypothetical protein
VALASDGAPLILVSGRNVTFATAGGGQAVQFPVQVAAGQRLGTFSDPQSGLQATFSPSGESGTVIVPLRLPGILAQMRIEVGAGTVQGDQVTAPVRRVAIEAGPVAVGPAASQDATLEIIATLRQIPESPGIEARSISEVSHVQTAGQTAARRAGLAIRSVRYAAEVRTSATSLVASGTLTFTIPRAWLDQWPEGSVRVLRIDSQGEASFLGVTQSAAATPDRIRLHAESPKGFSTFALVAVEAGIAAEENGGGSGMIIIIAVVAVAVIAVASGVIFLRRGKEALKG